MIATVLLLVSCGTQPEKPPLPPTPVVIPTETLPDTFTSTLELSALKTSLEDASSIIGTIIPLPDYLPLGYKIQEVYIEDSVDTHGQSPWHFTGQANLDLNAGIPADCSLF